MNCDHVAGLVSPKSLSFSEISSRSFRATWAIDATDVESYLVQYKPAEDPAANYVSVSVPGDTTTAMLVYLTPLTKYKVDVLAQYEKGESLPVTDFETTLEGQFLSFTSLYFKKLQDCKKIVFLSR